jgi:probable rRNA maturation factor
MKVLINNRQSYKRLNTTKIRRAALKILSLLEQSSTELSILFVDKREMRRLNTVFRGANKTTDVLSFPQLSATAGQFGSAEETSGFPTFGTSEMILGDIVISTEKAASQARLTGQDFYDEVYRLLIHGTLHLLGYNHENSSSAAKRMRKKEQEIFDALKKTGRKC